MLDPEQLTIAQLAEAVGVTPRTIRYYTAEGILPPPSGSGKRQFYGHEHVVRLRLARILREEGLPVGRVREQLDRWSAKEREDALALADRMRKHPVAAHEVLQLWEPGTIAPALPRALLRDQVFGRDPMDWPLRLSAAGGTVGYGGGADETTWQRIAVTPRFEIEYRSEGEGGSELENAVREIVDFARRRLAGVTAGRPRKET